MLYAPRRVTTLRWLKGRGMHPTLAADYQLSRRRGALNSIKFETFLDQSGDAFATPGGGFLERPMAVLTQGNGQSRHGRFLM